MDTMQLKKWIIDNNIRQRTVESFWVCFENYKMEEPEEYNKYFTNFDKDSLKLWLSKVSMSIRNWDDFDEEHLCNNEYVEAYISLEYKNQNLGYYGLLFNLSGEVFDDYFVIE